MVSLVPTISCTISRLNLLTELSHHYNASRFLRTLSSKLRPKASMYAHKSFESSISSLNFNSSTSNCSKTLGSNHIFNDNLIALGIETSFDDTAAAVVRGDGEILSQVISSQADLLARYGGVAPKMAEEAHSQVVQDALDKAKLTETDLSAVAVTIGPGLSLCLRVGVQKARKIAATYQLPYVGVHHMEAHALVARLCDRDLQFPFMALLVSGIITVTLCEVGLLTNTISVELYGSQDSQTLRYQDQRETENKLNMLLFQAIETCHLHKPLYQISTILAITSLGGHNLLVLVRDLGHYLQLGTTIDDATGEAYDKTAKWLGLDLRRSGGPAIEELALRGDANPIKFSVPMKQHKDCNFSYAGLKTQVKLPIESKHIDAGIQFSSASIEDQNLRADIAASFQRVAVSRLEEKCERAIQWALEIEPSIKHLVVSGGVASNKYVRARVHEVVARNSLQLLDLRPRWPMGEKYGRGRSVASHGEQRGSTHRLLHLTKLLNPNVHNRSKLGTYSFPFWYLYPIHAIFGCFPCQ